MERAGPSVVEVHEPPLDVACDPGTTVYFVTLIAGLEDIVVDEIEEALPDAAVLGALRGKVFFCTDAPPKAALDLLTVENVFAYSDQLRGLPTSEEGLEVIEDWLGSLDLTAALQVHEALHGPRVTPSFRITAHRAGEHDYNSLQVAAAAGAGVVGRYGWDVDLEDYDYDVRVYVSEDTAVAGLRLSPEAMHQRSRVEHAAASLNATVGNAMCRLTEPAEDQVVLDPMCGAGTLLVERARLSGPELLVGGDLFIEPLQKARANVKSGGVDAHLAQWDARDIALDAGSIDVVVCNMPWGRRIGSHSVNRHLYPGFVRELARVLKPGGIAALLTQEKRLITRLIGRHDALKVVREYHLSLSGMHPAIYLVRRAER